MKRRIVSLVIAVALITALLPMTTIHTEAATGVYTWITDRSAIDGSDYTSSSTLASKLNQIFDGNASVYSNARCTNLVDTRIGTSNVKNDGVTKYVGPYGGSAINSGTSCWIYANGVYYTLFGECTGNGSAGPNSEKLNLSSTSNTTASYRNFRDWGVRQGVGALIRTSGHSMIVLGYDENYLTILDGNGNSNGLVSIRVRSWDQVNFSVSYIIQPKESYFSATYPSCSHSYSSIGKCLYCSTEFDWESTCSADGIGIYKVTTTFTPRTDKPYDAATKASIQLSAGAKVEVLGVYENAFGNKWYKFSYNGQNYYVFNSYLEYVGVASLKVTCSDFSPADQAVLEKKAQPVIGTVSSNYPLSAIYAYLDGNHYATWQAGNNSTTQVSLRETDINYALPFSSLSDGKHTIELIAHSFAHDTGVKCHSSVFYMTAKTEEDTRPGKPSLDVAVDGDYVTFTWGATNNTTHYNLWLAKKNGDAEWEEVEQIFYVENGLSRTLEAGEYRAQLLSYNSNAWESDGSDWMHTWADDVFFTIDADTYTVTFDANGGTNAPASQDVQAGSAMFIPQSIPRYFGWNFKGWALTESASLPDYQPDEIITPTSDMVLYAVWQAPSQYYGADGYMCSEQVDYHGQGIYIQFWNPYPNTHYVIYGVGDEDNRVYLYDYDGNLLAFNDDGENGRNFELEYCFSSDEWYYIYVDFYNLSSTGELCFNIGRRYTITYDANGGMGAPEDTYRYYGSGALLSTTVPTRTGYTFLGWATSANATSASYQPGDGFTQSVDITLYAVWQRDVTEPDAQIVVSSGEALPGETVEVTITLKNNPGIASLKLNVSYGNILTLTNVSYNTAIGGMLQQPQTMTSPVILNWFNGAADSTGDWTFATLTFVASKTAQAGDTANITVTYNADDVYNIADRNVAFAVVNGTVEVADYVPGDINADGTVNNRDLTRLFQYLSNWNVAVNEPALDVNGDGSINNRDLTRLFQYLSNWNVEIH